MKKIIILFVLFLLSVNCFATVWGSDDLLPAGLGGMEDGSMWLWRADGRAVQSDAAAHSGTYSAAIINTGTSNLTARAQPTATFSTVLNRQHYYNVWTKQSDSLGDGYMRGVMYWNWSGGGFEHIFTSTLGTTTTTSFSQKGTSFRPTGTGVYSDFTIGVNAKTNSASAFFDDLTLYREVVMPEVSSDSVSRTIELGIQTSVSLYNAGGTSGDYNIYFDPDISVTSQDAVIHTVNWISDTQVDMELTAADSGTVELTLTNPYGNAVSTYTLFVSGGFQLSSDMFPLGMMGTNRIAADIAQVSDLGVGLCHSYSIVNMNESISNIIVSAEEYLDMAQSSGLMVIFDLNISNALDQVDGLSKVTQLVQAIKNHPALGFWYLYDEPELHGVTANELLPYYNMLKTETPAIPVAITHCWCDGRYDYADVEDIYMVDHYPVHDQAFPDAPLDNLTVLLREVMSSTSDAVMVMPQAFNYFPNYDPTCSNCRFPTAEELRYWAYASMIQGSRGLVWWSYGAAMWTGSPDGVAWVRGPFSTVSNELAAFVDEVEPAHSVNMILDGTVSDNELFMGIWDTDGRKWIVLTNNQAVQRDVIVDTAGQVSVGRLVSWGLSNNVSPYVEGGQFTVKLGPWETIIWEVSNVVDLDNDGDVDIHDLGLMILDWLTCTDPENLNCDLYWK